MNTPERRAVAGGAALSGTGAHIPKKHKRTITDDDAPQIVGAKASDVLIDDDEVYARTVAEWRKTHAHIVKADAQTVKFKCNAVALVFVADLHLGNGGVDYERCFADAELVARTPGMYLVTVGDLMDNFLFAKMMNARLKARVSIDEEWALVRRYLKIVSKKLVVAVSGNHDNWTKAVSGNDFMRETFAHVSPNALYDSDDVRFVLQVNNAKFPIRVRHQWQGSSIYNITHGIERAAKFENDFAVGVGGHTHASGVTRSFNNGGKHGIAILCGSYKRYDGYAREKGFYKPNASTAMTVIFDESGAMVGVDRLEYAARVLRAVRR